jgi:hypothetical protein
MWGCLCWVGSKGRTAPIIHGRQLRGRMSLKLFMRQVNGVSQVHITTPLLRTPKKPAGMSVIGKNCRRTALGRMCEVATGRFVAIKFTEPMFG